MTNDQVRCDGHSKLVWDKAEGSFKTVDPHPPRQIELLPCPFCGGEGDFNNDGERWHQVICQSCGCRGCEYPDDKAKAAKFWNRRPVASALPVAARPINSYVREAAESRDRSIEAAIQRFRDCGVELARFSIVHFHTGITHLCVDGVSRFSWSIRWPDMGKAT